MTDDPLRYEHLIEEALRGVVRRALAIVAKDGLPDGHHFHITFRTDHPGVQMSNALRAQYPQEMTIILQHMFWDLDVGDEAFTVALAFNTVRQPLTIPFDAILIFQDQSVGFVLQFQGREDDQDAGEPADAPERISATANPDTAGAGDTPAEPEADTAEIDPDNVVTLDSFRKK